MQSPPSPDGVDAKVAFRKPTNDAANRKYRRRSPVDGSSSSDGSPRRDNTSSPIFSGEDHTKVSEHRQRRDDERELDRDSDRSHYGRGGDLYKHSDRQSSRSSHGYSRHDDYVRHDKHANDEDRNHQRLSTRSGRESRTGTHADYSRQESGRSRSKDYSSGVDKSIRDRYDGHRSKDNEKESSYIERQKFKDRDSSSDRAGLGRRHTSSNSEEADRDWHKRDRDGRDEKRDYRRSSGDYRSDRTGHRNDFSSGRDYGGHRLKETYKSDSKELDDQKLVKEEKKKYDDRETNRDKDRYGRPTAEQYKDKTEFAGETRESLTKKPKFSNWDKGSDNAKDAVAAELTSSSSKQAQDTGGNMAQAEARGNDSEVPNDLNAAKVAAMKAAELVNKNLVGVGYMSADQKKKLLWGSKKSTPAEEPGHHWDTSLFGDRERQEKFNKLMGVKGEVKVIEQKPNNQQDGSGLLQAEKQKELQLDLEKQYTAGLRRRDGRTVGLGL